MQIERLNDDALYDVAGALVPFAGRPIHAYLLISSLAPPHGQTRSV